MTTFNINGVEVSMPENYPIRIGKIVEIGIAPDARPSASGHLRDLFQNSRYPWPDPDPNRASYRSPMADGNSPNRARMQY